MADTLGFQKKLPGGSYREISRGKHGNTNSLGQDILWPSLFRSGFRHYWPSSNLSKQKESIDFAFLMLNF